MIPPAFPAAEPVDFAEAGVAVEVESLRLERELSAGAAPCLAFWL